MKIQLASDLHLEFLQRDFPDERLIAPTKKGSLKRLQHVQILHMLHRQSPATRKPSMASMAGQENV